MHRFLVLPCDRARFAVAPLTLLVVLSSVRAEEPPPAAPKTVSAKHAAEQAQGLALFKEHVRSILAQRCLTCHGGDDVQGEFNLADRDGLLKGGEKGKAIVPGKHRESRLYKLIAHAEQPHMPYDEDKLPDAEIEQIAKWIDLGAPYDKPLVETAADASDWRWKDVPESARDFWSFQPLIRVPPPAVANDAWCRTGIDRFILARLESAGIAPNVPADRLTLIRRVYFDLVGLPPEPGVVEEFVASDDPLAYEKLVDRLLASPHFGERWARHWLDVARFAESHGFEQDYDRPHAYHYRDFVIRAFNDDMPYEQFVRWQLAGDEFAADDPLALMATGFVGAGVFPTQITKNEVERTRYDALDDMLATTGTAFLGLTIGCARCHDHKFDPIPQGDYYRLLSTFTTTVRSNIELDLNPEETRRRLEGWQRQHEPLAAALETFERETLPGRFATWLSVEAPKLAASQEMTPWIVLEPQKLEAAGGAKFKPLGDGSFLAEGANPDHDTYTVTGRLPSGDVRALRVEAMSHPSLPAGGPGRASNGNFGLSALTLLIPTAAGETADPDGLTLASPRATFQQNEGNLSIAATLDEHPETGWAVDPQFGKDHAAAFELPELPASGEGQFTLMLKFSVNKQHAIGRLRFSVSRQSAPPLDGSSLPQSVSAALDALAAGTPSALDVMHR
ncbi:MAG: DUF1549 domain-containing protein, partial [Planctomycetes bacterium]|nr:DUF1549 domain-containing protein [Planctomycetota bacterium]